MNYRRYLVRYFTLSTVFRVLLSNSIRISYLKSYNLSFTYITQFLVYDSFAENRKTGVLTKNKLALGILRVTNFPSSNKKVQRQFLFS